MLAFFIIGAVLLVASGLYNHHTSKGHSGQLREYRGK